MAPLRVASKTAFATVKSTIQLTPPTLQIQYCYSLNSFPSKLLITSDYRLLRRIESVTNNVNVYQRIFISGFKNDIMSKRDNYTLKECWILIG